MIPVIIPEFNCDGRYMRRLSFREQINWEKDNTKPNSDPIGTLILLTVVDAEGKPFYTRETLDKEDACFILALYYKVTQHNKITQEDIDTLKKSCRQGQNTENSSTLQPTSDNH